VNTKILIWVGIIGAAFALAWWKGYLLKFRNYWNETLDELKKCTWPSKDELKGSTAVVAISIGLLGAFTFVIDRVFFFAITWVYHF